MWRGGGERERRRGPGGQYPSSLFFTHRWRYPVAGPHTQPTASDEPGGGPIFLFSIIASIFASGQSTNSSIDDLVCVCTARRRSMYVCMLYVIASTMLD